MWGLYFMLRGIWLVIKLEGLLQQCEWLMNQRFLTPV